MLERLKELICEMAKFLTRLGAGLILSALPISNKESHFVSYARRFGFRADHTKHEPRAEIGGRGCIQGARPAIRATLPLLIQYESKPAFCMMSSMQQSWFFLCRFSSVGQSIRLITG